MVHAFRIRGLETRVDTKTLLAVDRRVDTTIVHITRNYNNINITYGNSFYQNQPSQTRESKIESMLDQFLEGQQKLMVDFDGKIDAVYTEPNSEFESLNTHLRKLETQVVQT